MSNKALKKKNLRFIDKIKTVSNSKINLEEIYNSYNNLEAENEYLIAENKALKDLIINNVIKDHHLATAEGVPFKTSLENKKFNNFFFIQIILGILVIILSLSFHIIYLAVTSCLLYNNGNPVCWYQNWLGIDIHTSFFIDLVLYSLIFIQSTLIILIIRNKLFEKK
ncbi:MAG: hypothetical protein ACFFHD_07240 [Promethearchaeota archaeon]